VTHAPPADRTRANTWPAVNERLDLLAQLRLRAAAAGDASDELTARIERLDHEWDFDRIVETEASLMGLLGLALALAVDRRLLVAPGLVATMLLLHSIHGWYPMLPLFRRLGVRTRDEIDRERYALKAVRGDFHGIPPADSPAAERAAAAWQAVCE
jgi:hypothetical protein